MLGQMDLTIAHNVPLEAELALEDGVEGVVVLASVSAIDLCKQTRVRSGSLNVVRISKTPTEFWRVRESRSGVASAKRRRGRPYVAAHHRAGSSSDSLSERR